MLPLSKKPRKSQRKSANFQAFDDKSPMSFSQFCVFHETSNILTPFADFSSLPQQIQALALNFSKNSQEKFHISPNELSDDVELMQNLAANQDNLVEKWLWNKYVCMKKHEYFNELLLYRDTKSSIDEAFSEFFCQQRQNCIKTS